MQHGMAVDVSIHAPAWGATPSLVIHWILTYVSIHAPAWGATRDSLEGQPRSNRFNPRARVGRDLLIITH